MFCHILDGCPMSKHFLPEKALYNVWPSFLPSFATGHLFAPVVEEASAQMKDLLKASCWSPLGIRKLSQATPKATKLSLVIFLETLPWKMPHQGADSLFTV